VRAMQKWLFPNVDEPLEEDEENSGESEEKDSD